MRAIVSGVFLLTTERNASHQELQSFFHFRICLYIPAYTTSELSTGWALPIHMHVSVQRYQHISNTAHAGACSLNSSRPISILLISDLQDAIHRLSRASQLPQKDWVTSWGQPASRHTSWDTQAGQIGGRRSVLLITAAACKRCASQPCIEAVENSRARPNLVELRIPQQPPCGVLIDVPVPSQDLHSTAHV